MESIEERWRQNNGFVSLQEQWRVAKAMNAFGNSFFGYLAHALFRADGDHAQALKNAFPNDWKYYLKEYELKIQEA